MAATPDPSRRAIASAPSKLKSNQESFASRHATFTLSHLRFRRKLVTVLLVWIPLPWQRHLIYLHPPLTQYSSAAD